MDFISTALSSDGGRRVCYGNSEYVVTGMELERDEKSGTTLVLTYDVAGDFSSALLPKTGGRIDIASGVTLSKATATTAEGGVTTVKLTYTTPEKKESEGDDSDAADEPDDGSQNDQSAQDAAASGKYGYKCSLNVTLTDEPLLTHPMFAGVGGAQLEYVKAFMDGARVWEKVPVVDDNGKPQKDKDGIPITKRLGDLLSGGGKLVDLAKKGITTYKSPAATFSESYVSKSGAVNTGGVGQVGTPGNAPKFKGRNWLLISRNSSLNDDGKTYTVSSVWMLSGAGGWDKDLYGA